MLHDISIRQIRSNNTQQIIFSFALVKSETYILLSKSLSQLPLDLWTIYNSLEL